MFSRIERLSVQTLTLGELRELVTRTDDMPDDTVVRVHVGERFNNPSDPGGEITITIEGRG